MALGIEKAGFNHLGLVEIDKDAASTLTKNNPNGVLLTKIYLKFPALICASILIWKKESLTSYPAALLARVSPMQEKGSVLRMLVELFFIIMRNSLSSFNLKCSCLKMFVAY